MSDYSAVAPPQNFSQSSAFAAALQRAKQIAAKINPVSLQNIQDSKLKRPLEDSTEPEAKKMAALVADPLIGLRGGPTSNSSIGEGSNQATTKVGSQTSSSTPIGGMGGICNEDIRVPDKMVGLIIGRGGEQITRLQSETGCKIQMAPEGGLPERVCTLTGSREAVNRAKELVLSIVNQRSRTEGIGDINMSGSSGGMIGHPGFVEIMIPGPKVGLIIGKGGETIKQLQEKSGAKMVVIQEGPSQEQEKPLRITGDPQKVEYAKQLVYELIAEKEMQMFHRGARGGDRGGNYTSDSNFSHASTSNDGVEVLVPRAAVGVVIGKGGDMIKKIQAETGARVQFQQGREDGPGDRKCLLSGKHQAVEQARQRIQELIDSVMRRDDGRSNMGTRSGPRGNGFGTGRNPTEYGTWDRRQGGPMQDKIETTFTVPSSKCGIIIGKGGETIKQINQQTGAHCELDRRNQSNESEKIFIIRGNPEQVEHAKRIFSEKLGMGPTGTSFTGAQGAIGYNPSWNAGTGYQAWPSQPQSSDAGNASQAPVQVNPQTGQPDYSAQWAEYYRSLGMHREADMIEQQAKQGKQDHNQQAGSAQNQSNPATATASTPGQQQQQTQQQQTGASQNGGQADYSAQWAEYYRSIGKIKEAEAIEAQMKAGKLGIQGNQMTQPQMQPAMQNQSAGPPGSTPNTFPQAYGSYPGMNAGSAPTGYYAAGAGSTSQPQSGQQNPTFPTNYQNYPYSQSSSDN
ncbi:far upstream element-binding protein 3 isoform X1 [Vespa crabro]|uniref:far upstream element-binding protein 3 isoform X1 n=1 Tax=Vespa crabro TaxID=7445 RepID=UPI001F00CA73|nr:far upstream element-binding protein 3 isoform X1 [Vespa crabro]XP_046815608.1 far upstream element-binding protein 3 isoform X1 [Vespa crabro]XP_046815609.1 far upstream element-binding protein 3 isoform X1 [Vespa crabro]XP_046815610.1 far upstream element-binding protein 3 isoform X1 [Vespa crabro]XP_046815611.1 far upstream element-binding protein 3 isoform X1 [Vespa crabro]